MKESETALVRLRAEKEEVESHANRCVITCGSLLAVYVAEGVSVALSLIAVFRFAASLGSLRGQLLTRLELELTEKEHQNSLLKEVNRSCSSYCFN